jgi:hypothetical protein
MATYRLSRNLESSLIEYFRTELFEDEWVGIDVQKSLRQDKTKPPIILINVLEIDTQRKEIGSGTYLKFPIVNIRIYAENDGQRLDLADWVLEKLEDSMVYYEYDTYGKEISKKTDGGRIVVNKILKHGKELANTNPEMLEKEDRYRNLTQFSCFVSET